MDNKAFLITVDPGGRCIFDLEPTNSLHRHSYWEICLVLRGTGEYLQDGNRYALKPGDLFASPPGALHEIRSLETRDLELFFVSFSIRTAPEKASLPQYDDDATIEAFVSSHHTVIPNEFNLNPYVDLIERATLPTIRDSLARLFTVEAMQRLADSPKALPTSPPISHEVQRAVRFIDEHCLRNLTVEEVAGHVSLAPRTLLRRFMRQVGHGIAKEIRQRRMRKAAHHLLMGYSVQEVARYVGVDDPSQFSSAFLSEIGLRPKVFQQTYLPGAFGSASHRTT